MKNEIEVVEKAHADLGASNCERWWNCPGSVDLIAKNGCVSKGSSYAEEGTRAHAYADWMLKTIYGQFSEDEPSVEADSIEMQEAVVTYVDFVGQKAAANGVKARNIFIEKRVKIDMPGEELFGTVDCAIHVPYRKLIVIDYKHGAGHKVDVFQNKQLLFYALGAIDSLLTKEQVEELETVEMVIVQPRCFGGGIACWEISISDLEAHRQELMGAVAAVVPGAVLRAGAWCKWCPAKSICPAITVAANEAAGVVFQEIAPKNLLDPNVLTLEQKIKVLDNREMIESWLDAIFEDVRNAAERGVDTPGWKLVTSKTNRKWIDEADAYAKLSYDIDGKKLLGKPKLIGIPAVEKLLKEAKKDPETILTGLVEKPEGKKTLAKASDPRVKQIASAVSAFDNI